MASVASAPAPAPAPAARERRALPLPSARELAQRHAYALVPAALLIVLFVVNTIVQPIFVEEHSWSQEMAVACPTILVGMAMTLPILSGNGGLDLSVGPLAGFMTVFIAAVLVPAGITTPALIVPIVILFGLASGAINGVLVAYVRLPAIIATLGMYLFWDGLGTEVLPQAGGQIPVWIVTLNGSFGPIPGVWIVLAAVAVVWLAITRGSFVRNLLAVGGDERAAFTAGVNVAVLRVMTYAFTGALACLAGMMLTGVIQSGDGTVGAPYTISGLTAVALGGISLAGGRGGLLGGALGGGVVFLISELLTNAHVSVFQVNILDGIILIVALALNGGAELLRRRSFARRAARAPAAAEQADGSG
jgi:ribose transport system permease protein